MKYFILLLGVIPSFACALNAMIIDSVEELKKYSIRPTVKYRTHSNCYSFSFMVPKVFAFSSLDGMNEAERAGEVESFINKVFSGATYSKSTEKKNAYKIIDSTMRIQLAFTESSGNVIVSEACIPIEEIEDGYFMVSFVKEKHCPELMFMPAGFLKTKYGEET